MVNQRGASTVGVGIVAVVVGVLIGFGVTTILKPKDQSNSTTSSAPSPDSNTKAADLRAKMDSLLVEHAQLASANNIAIIAGTPESTQVAVQVDKNSNDLADLIGTYYGPDVRKKFYDSWKTQIAHLADYANAAKKNDKAGAATANQALTSDAQSIANLLTTANPQYSVGDLTTAFSDHTNNIKAITDSYFAKDYAAATAGIRTATAHVQKIGDYLTVGIVKQYPNQF